jgi:hypothetical protein
MRPNPAAIVSRPKNRARMSAVSDRLDSWKAIAVYLNRGERTVRRWEIELGLPIHRLPGKRGASVFAYKGEIDAWLLRSKPQLDAPEELRVEAAEAAPAAPVRRSRAGVVIGAALISFAALALFAAWASVPQAVSLRVTPTGVAGFSANGQELWRHLFPGERLEALTRGTSSDRRAGQPSELITATSLSVGAADDAIRGGQLLSFTPEGAIRRAFSFGDRLTFGAERFTPPWVITDFRTDPVTGRIALAAHHCQWWPSVVTLLDPQWHREATFVNAGWVEHVRWLSPDRLLIAGFSQARDGGMLALVDTRAIAGQSPSAGTPFFCDACGREAPLKYIVMPRSEVNRVTNARFNRARIEMDGGRIFVHTVEASPSEADIADAVYEFTPDLDLIRATYGDHYWDLHRDLERRGVLDHPRERCPGGDGPPEVLVWDGAGGWRAVPAPRR